MFLVVFYVHFLIILILEFCYKFLANNISLVFIYYVLIHSPQYNTFNQCRRNIFPKGLNVKLLHSENILNQTTISRKAINSTTNYVVILV